MQLGEQVAQRHLALAAQRVFQRLRVHIRVAIAVATNPLAHAQKAVHGVLAQSGFQVRIQLGDFAQEGGLVVAQRVFNFVGHGEL